VNQINVSSIGSTDNAWNTANIDANSKSREFTGAFTFYFKLNTSAQGNLANDLTNKNLDLSDAATGSENLDHDSLLQKLQDANSNLNVNAIEIVNTNSSTIYNGGFGINYADSLTNF
jgi:hypothetical protein